MSCLRNGVIIVGLTIAAGVAFNMLSNAGTTPEQRAQRRYESQATAFCVAGGVQLQAIAPALEVRRALITRAEPERGATFACATAQRGETMVLYVRAHCGVVLECAAPLALADSHGEFVWQDEGLDVLTLPGVHPAGADAQNDWPVSVRVISVTANSAGAAVATVELINSDGRVHVGALGCVFYDRAGTQRARPSSYFSLSAGETRAIYLTAPNSPAAPDEVVTSAQCEIIEVG